MSQASSSTRPRRSSALEGFRSDLSAWEDHGWPKPAGRSTLLFALQMLVRYPGIRATLLYRLAHGASTSRIPFLPTFLTQLNVTLHAIELPPRVVIGPGLYMPHTVGSVIDCRGIGAGATLQGGITIGQRSDRDFPILGDGVEVGAGARVLGSIEVGDRAVIGAGAVVLFDVPADATAVGVPARIVSNTD